MTTAIMTNTSVIAGLSCLTVRCHLDLTYIFKSVEIYALTCHVQCLLVPCQKRGYWSLEGKKEITSSAASGF